MPVETHRERRQWWWAGGTDGRSGLCQSPGTHTAHSCILLTSTLCLAMQPSKAKWPSLATAPSQRQSTHSCNIIRPVSRKGKVCACACACEDLSRSLSLCFCLHAVCWAAGSGCGAGGCACVGGARERAYLKAMQVTADPDGLTVSSTVAEPSVVERERSLTSSLKVTTYTITHASKVDDEIRAPVKVGEGGEGGK